MSLIDHVARKIRALRQSQAGGKGISQEALARGVGVQTNTVSRWETGTYKPSIEDLERLARFFGVSILEFFPKQEGGPVEREPVAALLRAAQELPDEDLEELRQYAEFRKARAMFADADALKRPGRKRKDEDAD